MTMYVLDVFNAMYINLSQKVESIHNRVEEESTDEDRAMIVQKTLALMEAHLRATRASGSYGYVRVYMFNVLIASYILVHKWLYDTNITAHYMTLILWEKSNTKKREKYRKILIRTEYDIMSRQQFDIRQYIM